VARGFLSGVIAGTLVSGLGLGGASLLMPLPSDNAPRAGEVDVPAGSEFNQSLSDTEAVLPEAEPSPDSAAAPQVSAPEPDDLKSLEGADTMPAAAPVTGTAEDGLGEPQAAGGTAGVEVDSESPVLPSPQSAAPEQPMSEDELSISTDPAQPALPEVEQDSAFPEPEAPTADAVSAELPDAEAGQSVADAGESAAETTSSEATAEGDGAGETQAPTVDPSPDPASDAASDPAPEPEETQAAEDPETQEEVASSTIGNLAPEVTTNRLPSVGEEPESPPDPEAAETAQQADAAAGMQADARPPLERFASEFDNPGDKPLMAIILIDDGTGLVGLSALSNFPYPLSFAIDATAPDATDKAAIYHAAGFDVLAMVNLPEGASGTDTEVTMQASLAAVPEAVAVMEGTGAGLQSSRAAAEQLAPILLESGHGAIFFSNGLNTAQQLVSREGVPAASVFRDFDGSGQDATVIRRFLDQAAFKAAQEEAGVIMVGRLRPDTVSALLLWGLQDRASRVTLAPVSALLLGE
jgi:polysaccharide deacetylase 2 family uncharacterized protein YibQ